MILDSIILGVLLCYGGMFVILYRDVKESNNRLYRAWKDGWQIPAIEEPEPPKVPADPDGFEDWMSPVLRDWILSWDGHEARQKRLRIAKRLKAEGKSETEIIQELASPGWLPT